MVNQLELHVGYMQELAVQYCKSQHIQVQAWSPLGRRRVLEEPLVAKMAEKYGLTPAQFLLTFLLEQGIGVIPKASSMERLKQNLELPTLDRVLKTCICCGVCRRSGGEESTRICPACRSRRDSEFDAKRLECRTQFMYNNELAKYKKEIGYEQKTYSFDDFRWLWTE